TCRSPGTGSLPGACREHSSARRSIFRRIGCYPCPTRVLTPCVGLVTVITRRAEMVAQNTMEILRGDLLKRYLTTRFCQITPSTQRGWLRAVHARNRVFRGN